MVKKTTEDAETAEKTPALSKPLAKPSFNSKPMIGIKRPTGGGLAASLKKLN